VFISGQAEMQKATYLEWILSWNILLSAVFDRGWAIEGKFLFYI